MSERLCSKCHAPVPAGATYCLECGQPMGVGVGRALAVVLAVVLFVLVGVPALLVGACAVLALGSGGYGAGGATLLWLGGALAIGGGLLAFMIWAIKGMRG